MGPYCENILYSVAQEACDLAAKNGYRVFRTLKGGRNCFYPVVRDNGVVGVGINYQYHYLIYQENGFASYPMTSLFGKTIPMLVNGRLIFRKCTGINQFRSGHKNYWQRDANGELIPVMKQKRSWVHPGLPPKHFIADAVEESIKNNQSDIDMALLYDAYEDLEEDIDRRYFK